MYRKVVDQENIPGIGIQEEIRSYLRQVDFFA